MTQHHIDIIYWCIQAQLYYLCRFPADSFNIQQTNFLGLFGSIQRVSLFRINSQKSRINISGPNVCWIKVEKNIPYHVWFIYLHNIINIKQMYVISNYIISLVVWERGHLPITIIIYTFPFRPHLLAPHGREVHPIPSQASRWWWWMPGIMY